jgi:hypothetical protein
MVGIIKQSKFDAMRADRDCRLVEEVIICYSEHAVNHIIMKYVRGTKVIS